MQDNKKLTVIKTSDTSVSYLTIQALAVLLILLFSIVKTLDKMKSNLVKSGTITTFEASQLSKVNEGY